MSRFFIQLGALIVQENLQYYLKDTITDFTLLGITMASDAVQAVSVLFVPLLFGAFIRFVFVLFVLITVLCFLSKKNTHTHEKKRHFVCMF